MPLLYKNYSQSRFVYVCAGCETHLLDPSHIISKEFQGQHGRAFLCANVMNIDEDEEVKNKYLTTGHHTIKDISCIECVQILGWKYISTTEHSQRYKLNHCVLETALIKEQRNK